jgi:hypothetical protein
LGIQRETACDWYSFCGEVCDDAVGKLRETEGKIGGPGKIVEIDETHIRTRKYKKGRVLKTEQFWVFGGICREDRRCFIVQAEKRNAFTLLPFLQQMVHEDTIIISDEWRAYSSVDDVFCEHHKVCHKENFVSSVDPSIHIQVCTPN